MKFTLINQYQNKAKSFNNLDIDSFKMSFKMKWSTPHEIISQIEKLNQKYPLQTIGLKLSSYTRTLDPEIKKQFCYEVYPYIESWTIDVFCYRQQIMQNQRNSQKPINLLNLVSGINFTQLKRMNLARCNIQSIENISFLQFPFLVSLDLTQNYITSLQPLSKSNLPKLKIILISQNQFSSDQLATCLSKIKVNSQQFKLLQILNEKSGINQWNDNGFLDMQQFCNNLFLLSIVKFSAQKITQHIEMKYRLRNLRKIKKYENALIQKFNNKKLFVDILF